jgi:hypothetical protein
MPTLRSFVIDNEQGQLENIVPTVRRLFDSMGYQGSVEPLLLDVLNRQQAGSKIEAALGERPDVIFFDNHFGDSPALAAFGFQFIASVKRRFPDVIFVLMTREALNNNEFGKATPHPDIIVSKLRFIANEGKDEDGKQNQETYDDFFRDEFARLFHRSRVENIIVPENLRVAFAGLRSKGRKKVPLGPIELRSLIEQISYMGRQGKDNVISTAALDKLEGGLSGSVVCTISLSESNKPYRVPGVIKFSTRDNAIKEIQNHSRFVKWVLPYTWRVDIIGIGETENFGAVCYAFAHGGSDKPISLDTVIKSGNAEQVRGVIRAVFNPNSQTWYEQQRTQDIDIGTYLSNMRPYFISSEDRDQKADRLRSIIAQVCAKNGIKTITSKTTHLVEFGDKLIELKNFEQKIFSEYWNIKAHECIAHGDLNAGNVMVKPGSSDFSFIDFRYTGWHHRARDFCSIEGSLRGWFPRKKPFRTFSSYLEREFSRLADEEKQFEVMETAANIEELIQLYRRQEAAVILDSDSPNADRDLITLVRMAFLANFHGAKYREYCLAQLIHAWWLVCFEETWVESQIEIYVAEILSLLYFLWDRQGLR